MNISGGYWLWNACLRYIFTLPIMLALVAKRGNISAVHNAIKQSPTDWLMFSYSLGGFLGIAVIVIGMIGNSLSSAR